ncbi:MAG: hypothetical protein ACPGOV_09905 [Magnetovibrionaceae bacterium]
MRGEDRLTRALDGIYRSYLRVKPLVEGRPDSEARNPAIILDIARLLGLLPAPERILKITGSKGKGTTARMAARLLDRETAGPVGLFVSPEEVRAPDRMRINDLVPSDERFCALYDRLKPRLDSIEAGLEDHRYLSPFGIFLLMALQWFKDEGVEWFVLECGRGAAFDEVGRLPAKTAVVTSVFLEHPEYLGPTLSEIADNKFAIGDTAGGLIVSPQAAGFSGSREALVAPPVSGPVSGNVQGPAWIADAHGLAVAGIQHLLGRVVPPLKQQELSTASFGESTLGETPVIWEACINEASLDRSFVDSLSNQPGGCVAVVSLPDDKNRSPLLESLESACLSVREIALTGDRGRLSYAQAKHLLATLDYQDTAGLLYVLRKLADAQPGRRLYLIGTQTFIRLVRAALKSSAF